MGAENLRSPHTNSPGSSAAPFPLLSPPRGTARGEKGQQDTSAWLEPVSPGGKENGPPQHLLCTRHHRRHTSLVLPFSPHTNPSKKPTSSFSRWEDQGLERLLVSLRSHGQHIKMEPVRTPYWFCLQTQKSTPQILKALSTNPEGPPSGGPLSQNCGPDNAKTLHASSVLALSDAGVELWVKLLPASTARAGALQCSCLCHILSFLKKVGFT